MTGRLLIGTMLVAATMGAGSLQAQVTPGTNPRVLVVPFAALNVPESQQWISRGVQENLVADFGRTSSFNPIAFQGQVIVEDNATAMRLAKQAAAGYAIRGAAQAVGEEIRLTAQLIDAKTGDTVSTASVTGPASNLLKMEDELSAQLRGVSTTSPPAAAPVAAAPASPVQVVQQPPQIVVISQPAASEPVYQTPPNWPQGYVPNYPYGWGYGFGWPIVITTVNDGHHRHEHGGGAPRFELQKTTVPGTPGRWTMGPTPGGIVPLPGGGSFGTININPAPTPQQHFFSQPQGVGSRMQFVSVPAVRTGK